MSMKHLLNKKHFIALLFFAITLVLFNCEQEEVFIDSVNNEF